ncbi:hypothetical protein C6Y40_24475 [Alteromonas alba]|uniref:Uncharacterized protein n=1 Tax=Alteromonas alba TaxID=2079529 RepID=A0A2S9V3I5_9ALTE|nr:hypothetical protein [Alteromonas alba]PRO71016.1 hypothetical protein C6Y40_24475 [Alteromonas alba]
MDVSREDLKIIIMDLLDAGQFISDESFNTACECSVCKEKAVKVGLDIVHKEDCPVGRACDGAPGMARSALALFDSLWW